MERVWPIALCAVGALTLLQWCAVLALYGSLGQLLFRQGSQYKVLITDDGPSIDSPLPTVTGCDVHTGGPVSAADFRGQSLLLLFIDPHCAPSSTLLEALTARLRGRRDSAALLLVLRASPDEATAYVGSLTRVPVIADPGGQVFVACRVERTPVGMLVDQHGFVRMKGVVNTDDQLAGLIAGQGRAMSGLSWTPGPEGEPRRSTERPVPAPAPSGSRISAG